MPVSSMDQPAHRLELQNFLAWLKRNVSYALLDSNSDERRAFMPLNAVKDYLEADRNARLHQILVALFEPEEPQVYADEILQNFIAIFCILLEIGGGKYIGSFTSTWDLCDQRLPFDPLRAPSPFPIVPEDNRFFERFCEKQWRFCVPNFQFPMIRIHFEEKRILPIIQKDLIAGGGSAMLYRIRLHGSYNKLDPKPTGTLSLANTFVLKTYRTPEAARYYKNEVDAFRRLKQIPDPGLIGFHGSFEQADTYNVILEYADKGTLEQYFNETSPPVRREDITKFWTGLCIVLKGLKNIHDVDARRPEEGPQILHGWHQDVKPANILVTSRRGGSAYEWQFKLADLGLSHFKRIVDLQGEAMAYDSHGTRIYGAPECYRSDDFLQRCVLRVGQKVDIWSLGCVFSEAAIWVAYGYSGVLEYRRERKAETDKIFGFKDGGSFHDGEKVLGTVLKWHDDLVETLRGSDLVTARILDMIRDMLLQNERPGAKFLWEKSQRILQDARNNKKTAKMPNGGGVIIMQEPREQPPGPPPVRSTQFSTPTPTQSTSIRVRSDSGPRPIQILGRLPHEHSPDSFDRRESGSPPSNSLRSQSMGSLPSRPTIHNAHRRNPNTFPSSDDQVHESWESIPEETQPDDQRMNGSVRQHEFSTVEGPKRTRFSLQRSSITSLPRDSQYSLNRNDGYSYLLDDPQEGSSMGRSKTSDELSHWIGQASMADENQYYHPSKKDVGNPIVRPALIGQEYSAKSFDLKSAPAQQVPYLSVEEALGWRSKMKNRRTSGPVPTLPDQYLTNRLMARDHVFLIDDAGSMREHWSTLKSLVAVLAYIVKTYDPDGIEMYQTMCSEKPLKSKNSSDLMAALDRTTPSGISDIAIRLNLILSAYETKLHRAHGGGLLSSLRKEVRPLTLYVLTDAVWQPECDAAGPIKKLVRKLESLGMSKNQVGIQFIRFGKNPLGLSRLEHLDSGIMVDGKKIGLDIVDTEPCDGNIWKMLLGPIDFWFDGDTASNPRSSIQ